MILRIGFCGLGLLLLISGCASDGPTQPPTTDAGLAAIGAESLRADVGFLSDDLLAGRGPASEGDRLARRYIAAQLEAAGFEPGGPDGGWEQPFRMLGVTTHSPDSWTIRGPGGTRTLRFHEEFIANGADQQRVSRLGDEPWVFVGYGIRAPEYNWDDYKEVDVRGKVLVMLNNDPDWDDDLFSGKTRQYYGRWTYKYEIAREMGAVGAILVHTTPSAGYPWQVVQSSWIGEMFELPSESEGRYTSSNWITEAAIRDLWQLAGRDWDTDAESARSASFAPIELGLKGSLELRNDLRWVQTANVVGVLQGSDPDLNDSYVVYTAHHDHLGVGEPNADGDTIYNGALDNATGVAQMLAAARAFTAMPVPPRRSVMMLAVAAEEQGLLGSEYFARNPTVPAGALVANLNIDGGNIWGEATQIAIVGMGKSSMDDVARRAAAMQGREVVNEPFPDRGFFYRSDQFNFAKIGVPALYLDVATEFVDRESGWAKKQIEAWEAQHYHQPSDELIDSWSFSGMVQDAQLMFLAGWEVAESSELPHWNPGDEFEAARQRALAELSD